MPGERNHSGDTPLLAVNALSLDFRQTPAAVDRASFTLRAGTTLGLVGASGAGKSSVARAIMRLIEVGRGQILFKGKDISSMKARDLIKVRRRMQIVFQDPTASLSPRRTVAQTLQEPLRHFTRASAVERAEKIAATLERVGLQADVLRRYPHQLSSGQQQRIAIARAVIGGPELLIADEAVASLDVSVQAQILQLLSRLQAELGIALLFISHDLAVIRQIADEVAVMYQGQIIERAPADDFFSGPAHPYSKALLDYADDKREDPQAVQLIGRQRERLPGGPEAACVYAQHCPERLPVCTQTAPRERQLEHAGRHKNPPHCVKCHLYD